MKEKIWEYLAWKLPRRLVYWCAIRLAAAATTGRYSSRTPDEVSVLDALDAWESR